MRSLCCSKLRHNDNGVETNYTPLSLSLSLSCTQPADDTSLLPLSQKILNYSPATRGPRLSSSICQDVVLRPGQSSTSAPWERLLICCDDVEMLSVCSSALSHLGSTGWSLLQTCDTLSSAQPLLPVNRPASQGWGCTNLPTSENISEFYFRILQFQIYQIITIMTTQR